MARATIEFDSGEDLSKAIDLAESSSYARDIKIISERPFTVEGSASVLATFKGAFRGKGIRAMNSNQSFSNGRQRAEAYLNQRMERVGIQNIGTEQNKKYTVKDAVSGKVIEELQATNDAEAISKVRNKYGSRADYSSTSHVILFQGSSQIYM
jgi:hypothetical protein